MSAERECRVCSSEFVPAHRLTDECPKCAERTVESCVECGQPDPARFSSERREAMLAASLCFTCSFWTDLLARKDDPQVARTDGRHYVDSGRSSGPSHCLGMGGREYRIRWHDGREATTNNLWHQGTIPDHFRDRLPDNAEINAAESSR